MTSKPTRRLPWPRPSTERVRRVLPRLPAFLLSFCASLVAGCAVGPNYRTPKVPAPGGHAEAVSAAAAVSPTAGAATALRPAVDLTGWWHALKDPELDSLIERAISGNPDLLIALDRLQAAGPLDAGSIGPGR